MKNVPVGPELDADNGVIRDRGFLEANLSAEVYEKVFGGKVAKWSNVTWCEGVAYVSFESIEENRGLFCEYRPVYLIEDCSVRHQLVDKARRSTSDEESMWDAKAMQGNIDTLFPSDEFGHYEECYQPVPHYSDDIKCAFVVVSKLSNISFELYNDRTEDSPERTEVGCAFGDGRCVWIEIGDRPLDKAYAEVICRAALAYVESV